MYTCSLDSPDSERTIPSLPGGDGSAQRGRSVIYNCLVMTRSCYVYRLGQDGGHDRKVNLLRFKYSLSANAITNLYLYILNAVKGVRMFVRNAGRGQISSE